MENRSNQSGQVLSRDEIFQAINAILTVEFGLNESQIVPTAHIVDDLDLDSIDAIDLSARLEEKTGLELEEEAFKSIRTVQDIVDCLHALSPEVD